MAVGQLVNIALEVIDVHGQRGGTGIPGVVVAIVQLYTVVPPAQPIAQIVALPFVAAGQNRSTGKLGVIAFLQHGRNFDSVRVISNLNIRVELIAAVCRLRAAYQAPFHSELATGCKVHAPRTRVNGPTNGLLRNTDGRDPPIDLQRFELRGDGIGYGWIHPVWA